NVTGVQTCALPILYRLLYIDTVYMPRHFMPLSTTPLFHPFAIVLLNSGFKWNLIVCAHVVVGECSIIIRSGFLQFIDINLAILKYWTLFKGRLEFRFQPVVFVLFYLYACRFE